MLALLAIPALAHPMGTLSTNRSALVHVAPDATTIEYLVDFAEIPSVAEGQRVDEVGPDAWARTRMAELLPGLHLAVDGVEEPLAAEACFESTGAGDGGLRTVSLWCQLRADPIAAGAVHLRDDNFAGTVGWREMRILQAGEDALPFSTDRDRMTLSEVDARVGVGGAPVVASDVVATRTPDAFATLIGGDLSPRFVGLALLSALILGATHALSPGHGKTIVAAYLVGSRGTLSQALLLGLVVTATHVSSVLGLGLVTLFLAKYVVAAELFPWIGVASGLGVVAVGGGLLRARWRSGGADHDHGPGGHSHVVVDERGEPVGLGQLLVLGVTGGAVPCPSALVVLLSAIALHRIVFGLTLIVAFSIGLAAVLMAIGVLVVRAQGLLDRLSGARRGAIWLPLASAVVVMALGLGIALQSAVEGGLL